jgi:hypothetical protein
MSENKKAGGLLWPTLFFAASAGFLYLVFLILDLSPKECGSANMAYVMAQEPVKSLLMSPASADFPPFSAAGVTTARTADCSFSVNAYVDSQNGFGAIIRTPFSAKMVTDGTSWSAAQVSLN